jgi:hypothetical protein
MALERWEENIQLAKSGLLCPHLTKASSKLQGFDSYRNGPLQPVGWDVRNGMESRHAPLSPLTHASPRHNLCRAIKGKQPSRLQLRVRRPPPAKRHASGSFGRASNSQSLLDGCSVYAALVRLGRLHCTLLHSHHGHLNRRLPAPRHSLPAQACHQLQTDFDAELLCLCRRKDSFADISSVY